MSYQYYHNKEQHAINITATTGGDKILFHVLLPANAKAISVTLNNKNIPFKRSTIEQSNYADFDTTVSGAKSFEIKYE